LLQGQLELLRVSKDERSPGSKIKTYERDNIAGLRGEFVGQFFVVGNEVGNVNITVVLFNKGILP
jgi:hypothetical protein